MKLLRQLPLVLAILVVAGAVAFVGMQIVRANSAPDGPADLVWVREVCAHCRMHVGEPAFAVQIQTEDGRVLAFDDPGCAFELLAARAPTTHAIWFHHYREKRWLAERETAFVRVAQSPMGYGYAATDVGTPESVSLDEARRRMLGKEGKE